MVTQDAKCHMEIKRRINMGKDAFYKRKELMRGKLNRNLKKRMAKTLVWSVVLYGSETWTMRKEDIRRLEAFEMWVWRRMERVSWREHKTNEEILKMVGKERWRRRLRIGKNGAVGHMNLLQGRESEEECFVAYTNQANAEARLQKTGP